MEVKALGVGFIDCQEGMEQAFNTWYDTDHLPEHISLPAAAGGRRYVATPDCKALRRPAHMEELADGKGTFCTTYLFGTEDTEAITGPSRELDKGLAKERRIFREGKVAHYAMWRLAKADVRGGTVSQRAIPHLGHRGIYVALADVPDPKMRSAVDEWFDEVHIPDLLSVQGVKAVLRCTPLNQENEGRFLHILMLDEDPPTAIRALRRSVETWRAQGRVPSPGQAIKPLFSSAYRLIIPLAYDFIEA